MDLSSENLRNADFVEAGGASRVLPGFLFSFIPPLVTICASDSFTDGFFCLLHR